VQVLDVRAQGLLGSLVTVDEQPRPGVLVLGGSEGGHPRYLARLLAAEGFSCLALAYYGAPGLPRYLVEVPLEHVETAIGWLSEHPAVSGPRVGVLGYSKGAELALLAAATFPEAIGAVVAYAPSSVAFAGIAFGGDGRRRSSWSYRGEPLPFVPYPRRMRPAPGLRGLALEPVYRTALDDTEAVRTAAIPIERTRAPVLLVSGDRDRMWPSSHMAASLTARSAAAGRETEVVHLRYPDAGHPLAPWRPEFRWRPLARALDRLRLMGFGGVFDLGGRPGANRRALEDAWPRVAAFLHDKLG
jgi:dienelactone hydrolase